MFYACLNQMEVFSQLRISYFGQLQICGVGQLVLLKKEIEKGITPIIALLEDVEVDFVLINTPNKGNIDIDYELDELHHNYRG